MITNIIFFWTLSSFYLLLFLVELKEMYDVKADELMESILQDVYKGYPNKKQNIEKVPHPSTSPKPQTTKAILLATKNSLRRMVGQKMTVEEFKRRIFKREIKHLLEIDINPSPNFQNVEDEMTIQTRRFNKLTRMSRPDDARRENYFSIIENGYYIYKDKNKTMSLMQQFIYETHYMLPYMQVLRKKYKNHLKYQMGYCFALIRNLKKQQMMMYTKMAKNYDVIMTVYFHLELYQKIVKLDVDIKDVLRLMYSLDAERKKRIQTTTGFNPYN